MTKVLFTSTCRHWIFMEQKLKFIFINISIIPVVFKKQRYLNPGINLKYCKHHGRFSLKIWIRLRVWYFGAELQCFISHHSRFPQSYRYAYNVDYNYEKKYQLNKIYWYDIYKTHFTTKSRFSKRMRKCGHISREKRKPKEFLRVDQNSERRDQEEI